MADLEKIVFRLDAENTRLTRALAKSTRDLNKFERTASKTFGKFNALAKTAFAGIGIAAFAGATKSALDYADSIDKMSQVAGISTDKLQELRFAGDQLGVSTKEIDEGMRRFNRRLGEFANSGAGPAAKAIQQLGIQVFDTQGKFRGSEAVLDDVVQAMQKVETQAQRSALEAQLFGDDAGPKFDLLIRQGIGGLETFADKARDLGLILDKELIDNAVKAKDQLSLLSQVIKVRATAALINLTPVIEAVSQAFLAGSEAVADFIDSFSDLEERTRIGPLREELTAATERAVELGLALDKAGSGRNRAGLETRYKQARKEVDVLIARLRELDTVKPKITTPEFKPAPITTPTTSAVPTSKAIEQALPGQRQWNDLIEEAARLTENLRTPTEKYYDDVSKYKDLLDRSLITQETFTRGVNESWESVSGAAEESLTDITEFTRAAFESMQGVTSDLFFNVMQGEFDNMGDQFKATIDRMVADLLASKLLNTLGTAAAGTEIGGFFGALLGPGRARGGTVHPGITYPVNEVEPEYFRPNVTGEVIPLSKMPAANASTINVSMTVVAKDANSFRNSQRQIASDLSREISMVGAFA